MTDRLQGTDHSACPHVGARPLRWSAVVVSRGLKAGVMDSTPHPRSTHTGLAAAVCAILGASLLAVGAVLMKPVESSGISARIDGANGSIDPHQESNMKTLHAFRTAGALGVLAVTQIALVSRASAQSTAVQWRVADGGNGHWYSRVEATESWNWHESNCRALGGHLATVTSSAEQAFVGTLNAVSNTWIGGYQIPNSCEPGCGWAWVTGEMWSYQNWDSWAPDNYYPNDNYLHVDTNDNRWNDQVEDSNYPAILEWDADCNSDGIVDYGQCHDGTLPDYNGNNIPDCCEQGVQCTVGKYPVQWRVEDGGNGHWYEISESTAYWGAMRDFVLTRGAHLATITSNGENVIVSSLLPRIAPSAFFIGGEKSAGGVWSWVNGEPWGYTNWDAGEPNGQGAQISWIHGPLAPAPGTWNDHPASDYAFHGVLEFDADCNNDNIVDYGQILNGQLPDTNTNNIPDCCEPGNSCCLGDIYENHIVDGGDLGVLLSEWGVVTPTTRSDLNRDGFVNGADLGMLLANWGPCGG